MFLHTSTKPVKVLGMLPTMKDRSRANVSPWNHDCRYVAVAWSLWSVGRALKFEASTHRWRSEVSTPYIDQSGPSAKNDKVLRRREQAREDTDQS
jgi:hypothetical protein